MALWTEGNLTRLLNSRWLSLPTAAVFARRRTKTTTTKGRQLVLDVLSARPSPREARQFLKRFNQIPPSTHNNSELHYRDLVPQTSTVGPQTKQASEFFSKGHDASLSGEGIQSRVGIVKLQTSMSNNQLAAFASTLVQLQQLGLDPVVVVDEGISEREVTPSEIRRKLVATSFRVVDAIESAGGRATSLYNGIYEVAGPGAGIAMSVKPVLALLGKRQIPVIAPLAFHRAGVNNIPISSHDAMISLSEAVVKDSHLRGPVKVIFVNQHGGLSSNGKAIGFVNLEDESMDVQDSLQKQITLSQSEGEVDAIMQMADFKTARQVLGILPPSSSAIIASCDSSAGFISNLITDKPLSISTIDPAHAKNSKPCPVSNTVSRVPTVLRQGLKVTFHPSLHTLDRRRLQKLLEASFQKPLISDKFWDRLGDVMDGVILAGDYEGAAIVTNEPYPSGTKVWGSEAKDVNASPLVYLDKFVVGPTSQGIGVADILWKQLRRRYSDLSWRSRATNPVNKWYFDRSDGNLKLPGNQWVLFWYGRDGLERLSACREVASNIPASFGSAK
ncbi:hypothetical protein DFS34DRAFT_155601 [Phlyctochytrium arcticum]|nr:hypothetical protein DFS34DRAFT_155601 [Phlyctochytrium arcticum]